MQRFITKSGKSFKQLPGPLFILLSALGGLLLGIVARLWMRWISMDPEFTWSGTLTIVFVFAFFSTAQSLLFLVRRKDISKVKDGIFRGIAIFFTLPLFGAGGSIMLPVVLLGSLALWRGSWPKWLRAILGILSAAWAAKVAYDNIISIFYDTIIKTFGLGLEAIGQVLLYLGIYLLVIRLTKGVVAFPRKSI